jgi:hypothetical protein
LTAALPNPYRIGIGSRGWGVLGLQNNATGGGNGSIMVGMFVCLSLASQKPSKREFFIPARTDLGVKLLTKHETQPGENTSPETKVNLLQQVKLDNSRMKFQVTFTLPGNVTPHIVLFEVKSTI